LAETWRTEGAECIPGSSLSGVSFSGSLCTPFADAAADILPQDRSFTFILKTPPASDLLKKAANIKSGSGEPNKVKVGSITQDQLKVRCVAVNETRIEESGDEERRREQHRHGLHAVMFWRMLWRLRLIGRGGPAVSTMRSVCRRRFIVWRCLGMRRPQNLDAGH